MFQQIAKVLLRVDKRAKAYTTILLEVAPRQCPCSHSILRLWESLAYTTLYRFALLRTPYAMGPNAQKTGCNRSLFHEALVLLVVRESEGGASCGVVCRGQPGLSLPHLVSQPTTTTTFKSVMNQPQHATHHVQSQMKNTRDSPNASPTPA